MADIKEQIKNEIDNLWENDLAPSLNEQINNCIMSTLSNLQKGLKDLDKNVNEHVDKLSKDFEEKWTQKFEQQLEEIEKQNNELTKLKQNNINNNNINNNMNDNNKINNNINNINNNNNNFNNNNNIFNNNNNNFNNNYNNNNQIWNNNNYNNMNGQNNINMNNNNNNNNNIYNNVNNNVNNNIHNNNNPGDYDNLLNTNVFGDNNNMDNMDNNDNNNNNEFNINNINNYNLEGNDDQLRKTMIDFNSFNKPPLVKLEMFNNTNSLINLILLCISNIKSLISYYFNPNKEQKILHKSKENPGIKFLGPSFLKLLDNLWKSQKKEYSPKEIHEVLNVLMNNKYYSKDPGVIMNFILNQLHNELLLNPVNNGDNDPFLQFDEKASFQKYCEVMKQSTTKISDSCFSTIKMEKNCKSCYYKSYFFRPSPVINIYIEITKNDIGFNNLNLEENLYVYLTNEENSKIKELCQSCCGDSEKSVSQLIYLTTEILIFNINRDKDPNNVKHFKYPMKFDGSKVINKDFQLPNYELTTVIKKDVNNNNVNFVAYCKNFIDGRWYVYYNNNIEILNDENQLIDDKRACLLIYTGKNKN